MIIQLVQLGRIGDMILATPLFSAIKKKYPKAQIDVITGTKNYSIVRNNPNINKIKVLDKNPFKLFSFVIMSLKDNYDYHIDPKDHYSTESKILARWTKAKVKIGYNEPNSKVFSVSLPSYSENKGLHYTLRYFNALVPLDIEIPKITPKPELFTAKESEKKAENFISSLDFINKLIIINISASMAQKMWQAEKWIKLIQETSNLEITCILNSAPSERAIAEYISSEAHCPLYKPQSLDDVVSLIKRSDLLITPDTSLVHIAGAFNIPLIGLYSGLDEFYSKFHPLSDKYIAVKAQKGVDGIQTIELIEVLDALKQFEF